MSRPLVITDCDEVLLRMVVHFRDWLGEAHDIDLDLTRGFVDGMKRRGAKGDADKLTLAQMWELLDEFFETQMHRQDEIPGAVAAIAHLSQHAEVVVLTNLPHHRQEARVAQLRALGIDVPVYCNQGPKGPALQKILDERGGDRTVVFIDDLAIHIGSVAEVAPQVSRLHFIGEPGVAPHQPCALEAGHAHARSDTWAEALPWLTEHLDIPMKDHK